MDTLGSPDRRRFLAGATAAAALPHAARAQGDQALNVAVIGEPGPLEPTNTTASLVAEIDQHIYETLYAFNSAFQTMPLLAAGLPEMSPDGKRYTIPLRENVPFHDGTLMTADDVVASLKRWIAVSPRGRPAAPYVDGFSALDAKTVQIAMKRPYSPLLSLLAYFSGAAVVMPKRLAQSNDQMQEFIGTGPYRLIEHVPDRYVRLGRVNGYMSPPGAPDGPVGRREAIISELRFIPVPNPLTRVAGLVTGEYQYADSLTSEGYERIKNEKAALQGKMTVPNLALMFLNTKAGLMSDVRIRRAALAAIAPEDMLAAAFGDPSLWHAEGSLYPNGTAYYDPDTPGYNTNDPKNAAAMLKAAGYDGRPVRILTTMQYDYMYKIAMVAQPNLEDAGFKVDVQVMDWATLLQKRTDPRNWEMFVTSGPVQPEPGLFSSFNPAYPGWWDTPAVRAALETYVSAPDQAARLAAWKNMQALFYSEAPTLLVGSFADLYGISPKLQGYTPIPPPAFWNCRLTS
ncbi:MAG TPA: ABC transporter substrate-binding protein [Acetobacteraceae bacterium]|nr:ABC transporter substrate-binding protein [Acetobacteraceae bacterium]